MSFRENLEANIEQYQVQINMILIIQESTIPDDESEPDNEFEIDQSKTSPGNMTGNSSWSFSSLYQSTFLFEANTEGRWEDINESCEGIYFFWFRMLHFSLQL